MAKKIVQILTGIIVVLVILIVYFIQIKDDRMIMLCLKFMTSVFIVFLFASLLYYAAEHRGLILKIATITGALSLAYLSLSATDYIVSYSVRLDKAIGLSQGMKFFEITGWLTISAVGLVVLLYSLREKRRRT